MPRARSLCATEDDKPVGLEAVVLVDPTQPDISTKALRRSSHEEILRPVLPAKWWTSAPSTDINPTGRFVVGGRR